jgi:hypothetical protein
VERELAGTVDRVKLQEIKPLLLKNPRLEVLEVTSWSPCTESEISMGRSVSMVTGPIGRKTWWRGSREICW